jgi:hypothetical protein
MSEAPKVRRVMTQAINVIFELLKTKDRCEIWLYENTAMKIEGTIIVSVAKLIKFATFLSWKLNCTNTILFSNFLFNFNLTLLNYTMFIRDLMNI